VFCDVVITAASEQSSSKSATIEMYAPSSYNETVTGETLSSVSEKSESYSNGDSNQEYLVSCIKFYCTCISELYRPIWAWIAYKVGLDKWVYLYLYHIPRLGLEPTHHSLLWMLVATSLQSEPPTVKLTSHSYLISEVAVNRLFLH
jgi:hypothetical protein